MMAVESVFLSVNTTSERFFQEKASPTLNKLFSLTKRCVTDLEVVLPLVPPALCNKKGSRMSKCSR